ncbi:hypothetical protein ACFSJ3_03980 [Corallincola platygyrae]|uniref:Uncharacterized protein n=1 Tax=Corallincola platygyrae TaxID=1193278 RepID=A0ABW4XHW0_9GAMM
MITTALAVSILFVIYRFLKADNGYEVDWWMALVFVLVPAFINFFLSMGIAMLELPAMLGFIGLVLYFLVPYLFLKIGLEFRSGVAVKFALFVPVVVISVDLAFYALVSSQLT